MDIFIMVKIVCRIGAFNKKFPQNKNKINEKSFSFSPPKVDGENLSPCNTIRINIFLASSYNLLDVARKILRKIICRANQNQTMVRTFTSYFKRKRNDIFHNFMSVL